MEDSPRRREYYRSGSLPRSRSPRSRGPSQSRSPSPVRRSRSRSRSHGRNDAMNPGNTLYVTGLSSRVTEKDLEIHFSKEGKVDRSCNLAVSFIGITDTVYQVVECYLIVEPRTRISRGFAFVTMGSVEDAERCVKYLNQSVLEGRYITVEKSRRKKARTPTPGSYLGLKNPRDSIRYDRGRYRGGFGRDDYGGGYRKSPRRSPYHGRRSPYGGRPPRRETSISRDDYSRRGNGYAR